MDKKFNIKKSESNKHKNKDPEYSLKNFAIMYTLMKNIKKSMKEFPTTD